MPKLSEVFQGNYLKAEDLKGKSVKVKIEDVEVKEFDDGKKIVLKFEGKERGLVANKTNCAIIQEITGSDNTDDWLGRTITLYTKKVEYAGKLVPAIRVQLEESSSKSDEPGDPDW